MATRQQLIDRWDSAAGRNVYAKFQQLPRYATWPEPIKVPEILKALRELPFADEVPNGRDFRGGSLNGIKLILDECDFSFARINHLGECELGKSVFYSASISGGISGFVDGSNFERARFWKCSLEGSLRRCSFDEAILYNCNTLKTTDLSGSSFRRAKIKFSSFANSDLRGCDFSGAYIRDLFLPDVIMDKTTNFSGATLVNVGKATLGRGFSLAKWLKGRQATIDDATKFVTKPSTCDLLHARGILKALNTEPDSNSEKEKIIALVKEAIRNLREAEDPNWSGKIVDQLEPSAQALLEWAMSCIHKHT